MRVLDFPAKHTWFNSEPLSFEDQLQGKLVLIDFWTYCCINCLHMLPDLEYLEQKFESENAIVFIGCHSAKFSNEKQSEKVRDAVLKYDIKHPVINDYQMLTWKRFERRSWPSLVLVSPLSQIPILILSGEGHRETLDLFISAAYDFYYKDLDHEPRIKYQPEELKQNYQLKSARGEPNDSAEQRNATAQNLRYPGKVICIEKS